MARIAGLLALVLAVVVFANSAYVVNQWDQVLVTRFGKPVGDAISEPGIKFKMPLTDEVHRFDKRFLEWDGKVTQVPTKEKRFILMDTYARWRIVDPLLFFQRLQNEDGAQRRLDGILNGEARDAIARHNLAELIRTSNREPIIEGVAGEEIIELDPIEVGREVIRQEILDNAKERVEQADLGIELLDIQFKRINYVEDVRRKVYDRMIAERKRIADRFRSEGQGEASRIRGEKERELKRIQSEAYREAQEIVGKADAEATQIYADAYNQSADSRKFYEFIKTMETYQTTFDEGTMMMLSTDSDFYRYISHSDG